MHVARAGHKIEEGQVEQPGDLGAGPVSPSCTVIPAKAGIQSGAGDRTPAFAGLTDGVGIQTHAAFSSGGMLWPSSFNTSAAASARFVPGPKIAETPAS